MMYRLTKYRGEGDSFLHSAVFPIRDANFVEIEHQFGYPSLYVVVQVRNYSLEKSSRYLRALLFLWATISWITSCFNPTLHDEEPAIGVVLGLADLQSTLIHQCEIRV
jgi:hypothetical protein